MTELLDIVRLALAEDLGADLNLKNDLTGQLLKGSKNVVGVIKTNESGILAGVDAAEMTFQLVSQQAGQVVDLNWHAQVGDSISPKKPICEIRGEFHILSAAERTALNFLSHLSGIATTTSKFVEAADGKTKIYDTRKTTPGLRTLEKAAVVAGGGHNHRLSLSDAILLKDNHLVNLDIKEAVENAQSAEVLIQVECETIHQVTQALKANVDAVLLDNMSSAQIKECVELVSQHYGDCITEASGGIQLADIPAIAATGVDRISLGALTKNAPSLDLSLDWELDS